MVGIIHFAVDEGDAAGRRDDIGGAVGHARPHLERHVIARNDARAGRGDREFARAFLGGEGYKVIDRIGRHADDRRARRLELVDILRKLARFGRTARRERLGEEIEHHRPALELVRQGEGEGLARQRAARREVGGLRADRERSHGVAGRQQGGSGEDQGQALHRWTPWGRRYAEGSMRIRRTGPGAPTIRSHCPPDRECGQNGRPRDRPSRLW